MFGDDIVTIDTGGFLFWRNTRSFKRDQIEKIHESAGSYSTCFEPVVVELKSGELVSGTRNAFNMTSAC